MSPTRNSLLGSLSLGLGLALLLLSATAGANESDSGQPALRTQSPRGTAIKTKPARITLRGTRGGNMEIVDAEGRVQESFPPGSLSLRAPNPAAVEMRRARRERQEAWAEERARQLAPENEPQTQAKDDAEQKKLEAEKAGKAAKRKATLEADSIRLQDPSTGKYLKAVPVWRLPEKPARKSVRSTRSTNKPPAEPRPVYLYDHRTGRRIKAVPLDAFSEEDKN